MTEYHLAMCSACDSLDVVVDECDACDETFCNECMADDGMCETCSHAAFMRAVDAVGAEAHADG